MYLQRHIKVYQIICLTYFVFDTALRICKWTAQNSLELIYHRPKFASEKSKCFSECFLAVVQYY